MRKEKRHKNICNTIVLTHFVSSFSPPGKGCLMCISSRFPIDRDGRPLDMTKTCCPTVVLWDTVLVFAFLNQAVVFTEPLSDGPDDPTHK